MIGATELLIVGGIIFVLFGATAIPKFARSLGKAKREFEKGTRGDDDDSDAGSGEKRR